MRRAIFALMGAVCLTVPGMVGCSHESPGEDGAALGSVSLPLVMSTPSAMYRLSDATFTIDGPTPTILNSSDDPAEVELTASLGAGSYEIVLEPGWALERDGGSGFVAVSATLLSSNPRSFTIEPSTTTALTYQFETSGTVVGGDGQLTVDLQVDDLHAVRCGLPERQLVYAGRPGQHRLHPSRSGGARRFLRRLHGLRGQLGLPS